MENLKKILEFLSPLPVWLRLIIVALVTVVVSLCLCLIPASCGITQSTVNNIHSDNNTIEMGVTPSTTTSTSIDAQTQLP